MLPFYDLAHGSGTLNHPKNSQFSCQALLGDAYVFIGCRRCCCRQYFGKFIYPVILGETIGQINLQTNAFNNIVRLVKIEWSYGPAWLDGLAMPVVATTRKRMIFNTVQLNAVPVFDFVVVVSAIAAAWFVGFDNSVCISFWLHQRQPAVMMSPELVLQMGLWFLSHAHTFSQLAGRQSEDKVLVN